MNLTMNSVYAVETEYETYIGTYRGHFSNRYVPPFKDILWDAKVRIKNKSESKGKPILVRFISINKNDIVYDINKIKHSAKKAKESFEQRALNMILKRLINEHFEW